ncbi:bifunctional DNA polymerase alpha-delta-epsilon [Babesia duncani]|uniref:Bifunctional DNA polymerase alpha-delta-epsilon n=1 Tax=Babesia duncani TaxID=323732 RepID=A0AAD9PLG9_9APIC|nr:bifunctional DNA polymerase alpha-delta-epsilon [Babesia duncani]
MLPHALREYMETHISLSNYSSDDDYLSIEDDTLRFVLSGNVLDPRKMVTGLIIALKGSVNELGHFVVCDYLLPGPPKPLNVQILAKEEKYLAFVSGLEISTANANHQNLMLLRDFFLGNNPHTQKIIRIVIAGNGIGECDADSLAQSDIYFAQLAASVPVDLMPGPNDPTNLNLPQQPIHPCLMEHSKRYTTFKSTTNPYFFTLDGIRFLGVSGQSVKGVCDYSTLNEMDALKMAVDSRIIAPTAADSLGCHPDAKMFNLINDNEFPHVFFSGNCNEYAVDSGMPRLICVPNFNKQPVVVLFSLLTLNVSLIKLA